MSDMQTMMTKEPLDTAAIHLDRVFICIKSRTDLTPEERAALEAAQAAAQVFSMMVFDRVIMPTLASRQAEDAS